MHYLCVVHHSVNVCSELCFDASKEQDVAQMTENVVVIVSFHKTQSEANRQTWQVSSAKAWSFLSPHRVIFAPKPNKSTGSGHKIKLNSQLACEKF